MKNKHELRTKVEGQKWNEALDKSFQKKVKEVKIDGFRKGKAPRDVYEKKFGKESLYMEAVDIVIPEAYQEVVIESNIIPIVQPKIDIKSIDENGVEFLFTVITKPEIKLKKYKGLKINKPKAEITAEEIKEEIKKIQQQYSEIIIKDGSIEEGDTAVIDFEGFKDGKAFEGGKGANYPLEIGSKTFIPGFEEQLIGLKAGEEKEIEVTFPKDYPSEDLKGQKVIFKTIINEVKTKSIPELNDDFYKDLDMENVTNEKELNEAVKKQLIESKESAIESSHIDNILLNISKEIEVDIPEELIEEEIHRMVKQFEDRLKMQGATLEQYCQLTGTNQELFNEQFRDEAIKVITYRLMLEKIAELEKIEIDEATINEELLKMTEKYQMNEEQLVNAFGSKEVIKYDLKMRKAIEFLKDNN